MCMCVRERESVVGKEGKRGKGKFEGGREASYLYSQSTVNTLMATCRYKL